MGEEFDPWDGDCLDRKRFGELLLACLQGEAVFCDEAFVVALTGKFGSGKSCFLDMWKQDLERKASAEPTKFPLVVRVNAWESDFSGEPLLALVSEISKQLSSTQKGKEEKAIAELKRGVAGFISGGKKVIVDLASGYIEGQTGVDIEAVVESVGKGATGSELDRRAKALFADFEARLKSLENLRSSLRKFIESRCEVDGDGELKLILIVDELDRCHPRYAIEFLEAIKHVFNVKGMAVVLGVDWEQLCCTATAFFGQHLDTEEYFRKFIARKVPLSRPGESVAFNLTRTLFYKYFGKESLLLKGIASLEPNAPRILNAMVHALDFTPRHHGSALHLLSSFLRSEAIRVGQHQQRHHFLIEFFVVLLWVRHPTAIQEYLKAADVRGLLKVIYPFQLSKKLNVAGLNGDWIEGRILGTLRDESNDQEFDAMLDEAGYLVPPGGDGQGRHQEFRKAVKQANVYTPSSFASIARRVTELDIFER